MSDLVRALSQTALQFVFLRLAPEALLGLQATEESMGEYVKALVKLDRLDNSRLVQTIQVRTSPPLAAGALVV
jgi:hypothetical protein